MKTFKIILICIFSATLAFVAFRSSLRGTKAIYETTQPQYREIKEEINISGNVFPMKEIEIKSQISGVLDKINVLNPEKPDVPLNKNDAFQKVQKRHVQEKR